MRGAMAAIELYKAEIAALEALVNVDKAKVDIYKARIEAMSAFVGLCKTQVDAVLAQASLEKMKLEIFQIKVQAYAAQVQAKNAEWQGYVASLGGRPAKVKAYSAQVRSHNAEINGYKAKIEAEAEAIKARALSQPNQGHAVRGHHQGLQRHRHGYERGGSHPACPGGAKVEAFKAETSAAVAKYQVRSEYYKSAAMVGIENSRLSLQAPGSGCGEPAQLRRGARQHQHRSLRCVRPACRVCHGRHEQLGSRGRHQFKLSRITPATVDVSNPCEKNHPDDNRGFFMATQMAGENPFWRNPQVCRWWCSQRTASDQLSRLVQFSQERH